MKIEVNFHTANLRPNSQVCDRILFWGRRDWDLFRNKFINNKKDIIIIERNTASANRLKVTPFLHILQYLLIIAGVYGTVFSIIDTFHIETDRRIIITVILVSALYFYEILRRPKLRIYFISMSIMIYILAGYRYFKQIENGFYYLENYYIEKFNLYYSLNLNYFLVDNYDEKQVMTILFVFILILVSLIFCCVITRNFLLSLLWLITILFLILPLTVGLVPETFPFAAYLISAVGIKGIAAATLESNERRKIIKLGSDKKINKYERKLKQFIGLKVGGTLTLILILLFLLISVVLTPGKYDKLDMIPGIKNDIQKGAKEYYTELAAGNFNKIQVKGLEIFHKYGSSGGLSGGKLGRVSEVVYQYNTALRITTPITADGMYLKGYVGSVYKGDHWEGLSKEDERAFEETAKLWKDTGFQINNQNSYFMSLVSKAQNKSYKKLKLNLADAELENVNADQSYYYAPYNSVYSKLDVKNIDSTKQVLPKQRQNKYKIGYYSINDSLYDFSDNAAYENFMNYYRQKEEKNGYLNESDRSLMIQLEDYHKYEAAYRDFVYKAYTKVPENSLERIKNDFGNINYNEYRTIYYGPQALDKLINSVRDYLNENTRYTLKPGMLPKNKDFIEYFLYENKAGYCTHYASAATMIFRTMGIPARYVEGYVIKPSDINQAVSNGLTVVEGRVDGKWKKYKTENKTIDILDANAHSWVEIYLDGFGWVPVEVTPGNNINETANTPKAINRQENVTPTPSSKDDKEENLTEDSNQQAKNINNDSNKNSSLDKNKQEKHSGLKRLAIIILSILLLFITSVLLIILRANYILAVRKKALGIKNRSKKVLLHYKEILRIFSFYRIDSKEDFMKQEEEVNINIEFSSIGNQFQIKEFNTEHYNRYLEIILKAKFDKNWITQEEAKEAEEYYESLLHSVYKELSFVKKLYLKYIMIFQ